MTKKILAADIGGTNSRFGVFKKVDRPGKSVNTQDGYDGQGNRIAHPGQPRFFFITGKDRR